MADPTENKAKISLKVMVHKEKKKVIFAEAGSDFVDILFSFMTLPLGTIVRVLGKCQDQKIEALGSLKNLYQSLVDLPTTYLSSEETKYLMLNPRSSSYDLCNKLKLNIDDTHPPKYFVCQNLACNRSYSFATFSTCSVARCGHCSNLMNREIEFKNLTTANTGGVSVDNGVFVSKVTTFVVTDDFRVLPNTSSFILQLLSEHGITDSNHLEELTLTIGLEQIPILLNSALIFKCGLTYFVFSRISRDNLRQKLLCKSQLPNLQKSSISFESGPNSKRMALKVTLQKSTSKFLFAEAAEDFVDFLFGFFEIPLGTIIGKLMNGFTCVESLDNLYASISNMIVGKGVKSGDVKDVLLKPHLEQKYISQNRIFPLYISKGSMLYLHTYKIRSDFCAYVTSTIKRDNYKAEERFQELKYKDPQGGFLKASAKFMLLDDLVVTPLSSFSTIALLNKLKVPFNDIEEHELSIGIEEGLMILKASLNSSSACLSTLTDDLLKGNDRKEKSMSVISLKQQQLKGRELIRYLKDIVVLNTMADPPENKAKISLKVMVHKEKKRVIYAEADSDFVDILFSFMTLPLGTIVKALGKCQDQKIEALGSLKNLYQSLVDLPMSYFSSEETKYLMLNPRSSSYDLCRKLKLNIDDTVTDPQRYFVCQNLDCPRSYSPAYFSSCSVARCSRCSNLMSRQIYFQNLTTDNTGGVSVDSGVFVSKVTTFIVADDFRVMPNTSSSILQLLSDHGITDSNQLEEQTLTIGLEQIPILLNSALIFKCGLTYFVFSRISRDNVSQNTSVQSSIGFESGQSSKRMALKVTLQKSTSKFLFAEAAEDFVDFLFGFFEIPLGTIIGKLMNGVTCVESLDNLYASISNMIVGKGVKSRDVKDMLLKPHLEQKHLSQNQIFPLDISKGSLLYLHTYRIGSDFCAYVKSTIKYDNKAEEQIQDLIYQDLQGGFLKESAKFMLMDDLVVTPLSSSSTIVLLNKLKVPFNDIEEHELSIGIEEGLKILRASLKSSSKCLSILTDDLLKGMIANRNL